MAYRQYPTPNYGVSYRNQAIPQTHSSWGSPTQIPIFPYGQGQNGFGQERIQGSPWKPMPQNPFPNPVNAPSQESTQTGGFGYRNETHLQPQAGSPFRITGSPFHHGGYFGGPIPFPGGSPLKTYSTGFAQHLNLTQQQQPNKTALYGSTHEKPPITISAQQTTPNPRGVFPSQTLPPPIPNSNAPFSQLPPPVHPVQHQTQQQNQTATPQPLQQQPPQSLPPNQGQQPHQTPVTNQQLINPIPQQPVHHSQMGGYSPFMRPNQMLQGGYLMQNPYQLHQPQQNQFFPIPGTQQQPGYQTQQGKFGMGRPTNLSNQARPGSNLTSRVPMQQSQQAHQHQIQGQAPQSAYGPQQPQYPQQKISTPHTGHFQNQMKHPGPPPTQVPVPFNQARTTPLNAQNFLVQHPLYPVANTYIQSTPTVGGGSLLPQPQIVQPLMQNQLRPIPSPGPVVPNPNKLQQGFPSGNTTSPFKSNLVQAQTQTTPQRVQSSTSPYQQISPNLQSSTRSGQKRAVLLETVNEQLERTSKKLSPSVQQPTFPGIGLPLPQTRIETPPKPEEPEIQVTSDRKEVVPETEKKQGESNQSEEEEVVLERVIEHYSDQSTYEGQKKGELRHGRGILRYVNGGVYDGEWKNGKMEGFGRLLFPSGKPAYEGEFKEDKFEGSGVLYNEEPEAFNEEYDYNDFSNVDNKWIRYEGEFKNDAKEGHGGWYLSNGEKFEGEFYQDRVHGLGIFIKTMSNERVTGKWQDDKLVEIINTEEIEQNDTV